MKIALASIAAALLSSPAIGQVAAPTQEVHVAVEVRNEQGNPVGDLRPRDFIVSIAGGQSQNPLQLQVGTPVPRKPHSQAGVPTRLLVVLLTNSPSIRKTMPWKLNNAFMAGWQIRVEDSAGAATSYTSSVRELRAALGSRTSIDCSLQCSMRELTRFPGRRVVFLVTDKGTAISPEIMSSVLRDRVAVYHVGGDPAKQLVSYGYSFGYSPIINHPMGPLEVEATFSGGGAEYERRRGSETEDSSFRSAIQDATSDAKGYYDLKLQVPADIHALTLKVKVYGNAGAKCFLFAEPYAEGALPPSLTIAH